MGMRAPRFLAAVGGLTLAIVSSACDRRMLSATDERGGSGRIGGAPGGSQSSGAGGAGQGSAAGAPGGAVGGVDQSTRARSLAPLATTDLTIDQASGAALFDLARDVGYAHGYAECTCVIPKSQMVSAEALDQCARAETLVGALF